MDYFEILKRFVLREDFPEKSTKARAVPLAITKVLDKLLQRYLWRCAEGPIGGAAGRSDPQLAVKDERWLAYGIDDGLSIRKRVPQAIFDFMSVRIGSLAHVHSSPLPGRGEKAAADAGREMDENVKLVVGPKRPAGHDCLDGFWYLTHRRSLRYVCLSTG